MDYQVLVIFEEVPNHLRIYKVTVDKADRRILKSCHGLYAGGDEMNEKLGVWLLEFLADEDPIYSTRSDDEAYAYPIDLKDFSGDVVSTGILL